MAATETNYDYANAESYVAGLEPGEWAKVASDMADELDMGDVLSWFSDVADDAEFGRRVRGEITKRLMKRAAKE